MDLVLMVHAPKHCLFFSPLFSETVLVLLRIRFSFFPNLTAANELELNLAVSFTR